jgi:sigma-B regulation protein RsbU (phosphoserine phosphatase)
MGGLGGLTTFRQQLSPRKPLQVSACGQGCPRHTSSSFIFGRFIPLAHSRLLDLYQRLAGFIFQFSDLRMFRAGRRSALPCCMESLQTSVAYREESAPTARVLVADDQPHVLDALELMLKNHGYRTEAVTHPARVLQALESREFDVVLMDLNYTRDTTAGGEGLDLVSQIRLIDENLPLVVMTAWSSVDLAVEAMRRGASDFVQKPWHNGELLEKLERQVERCRYLRRAERQRADELRDAREIQNHLLPTRIPQIKDYEIAGVSQPVRNVGGDFYDVVRVSETQTVLCIADVSGKGMPAALLMSSLQAALRPLMWDTRSPRELCSRLNRILCEIAPVGKFISFFYAVLDSKDNRLTYCNAGHNPPVLVRANGMASELNAAGAVLGQFPDWVYEQSDLLLRPGDRLIMFTDGLIEASNLDEEQFGEQRLTKIAQENLGSSAEELKTQLMQAASEHCGGRFQDDASMIVVRAV